MAYTGIYERTIFYNPVNKYSVISVKTSDRSIPEKARSAYRHRDNMIHFAAVGYELPRTDQVSMILDGEWKEGKNGFQLHVTKCEEVVPQTREGIKGYLSSRLIKGIGGKTAELIVDRFGADTLPGLVIDAIENHDGTRLMRWAEELREKNIRTVNMLGCHDGIPMLDLKGLLSNEAIEKLIALIVSRGGMIKNLHGAKNVYYQVNCTYFSALGADERKMLLARAIQLFMPGKPQVWYLDLFAGENDLEAVRRGGEAAHKEINRTNLTRDAVADALKKDVVRDQLALLRMRNTCPAFDFDADMTVRQPQNDQLEIIWEKDGSRASLRANLTTYEFAAQTDCGAARTILTSR